MERVLICCESDTASARIEELLAGGYETVRARLPAEAREKAEDAAAAVLAVPLRQDWADAVRALSLDTCAGLIALLRGERRAEAEKLFGGLGVAFADVSEGKKAFFAALACAAKVHERLRAVRSENDRLKSTIGDLKLVDRAKCALIQYLNMTEADAHRFIEKQAMNRRLSRREIALEILKAYES